MGIDRVGDGDEVLKELRRHVLGRRIVLREFQCDGEHGVAKKRHPRGTVGLLETSAGGQWLRAIENADIIQAKKAATEDVLAFRVKLITSFWNVRERKTRSRSPRSPVILYVRQHDQA